MFRFARLCVPHQRGECKEKGAACEHLHVCARYLMNRCPNGDTCGFGHRLEDTILGKVPFPSNWCLEKKLTFVRECHPCFCPEYNSAGGCQLGDTCFKLHVCNDSFVQQCVGNCQRSHSLVSEACNRIYKHHMVFGIASKSFFPYLLMPLAAASEPLNAAPTVPKSAHSGPPASVQPRSYASAVNNQNGTARLSAAVAACDWGRVNSCESVVKFLIQRGGSCSWEHLRLFLALPAGVTFKDFEKHLRTVAKGDSTYSGRYPKFIHGLNYNTGHKSNDPDSVNMYRYVRVCGHWQQNRGKCHNKTCDLLHVCRDWLVDECGAGPECPLGHSFASTQVDMLPFPLNWSVEQFRRFVRECHPTVCVDYNTAGGCHRLECSKLHLCNSFLLGRCSGCTRSHDTSAPSCLPVYKLFGIQDLPARLSPQLFRWLLMPVVCPSSDEASTLAASATCAASMNIPPAHRAPVNDLDSAGDCCKPSAGSDNSLAAGFNELNLKGSGGSAADLKSTESPASTVPKAGSVAPAPSSAEDNTRKYFPTPSNLRELVAAFHAQAAQQPSEEPSTKPKNSEETAALTSAKKPYICEALLRGVCGNNCEYGYFHVEIKFDVALFPDIDPSSPHLQDCKSVPLNYLWQYRVPREVLSSTTGLEYILKREEVSLTDDGWLSFEWNEGEALEKAFVDPSQESFIIQGEIRCGEIACSLY